jgi:hypothetical protein
MKRQKLSREEQIHKIGGKVLWSKRFDPPVPGSDVRDEMLAYMRGEITAEQCRFAVPDETKRLKDPER